jgi:hypothetical protein
MPDQHAPRGEDRLIYHADGGMNVHNLWEPFHEDQLTRHMDDFADNGVDIFSQLTFAGGGLKPGLFVPEHPEFAWWRNDKLKKLIDAGVQPIEVMIDRAHRRGMKFFAKLRVSDWHRRSVEESGFIGRHPHLQNPSMVVRPALDYTHAQVRQYHLDLIEELVRRFDLDGITLNYTRSWQCFPTEAGGERHALMTDFVRQARRLLDAHQQSKGRRIELCAVTLPHLDLCRRFGLDVETWIREDLINIVCVGNTGTSDPNMDHAPWAEPCAASQCRYFPMAQIVTPQSKVGTLGPEHLRALAKGMIDGGADGIAMFNWVHYWARGDRVEIGYPLSLASMRELRDPARLDEGARHYRFRPLGAQWPTREGMVRDDFRVTMPRRAGVRGEYPFRLPETLSQTGGAHLYLKVLGLAPQTPEAHKRATRVASDRFPEITTQGWPDRLQIDINGEVIAPEMVRRVFRPDGQSETDGRALDPFTLIWFELRSPPARHGLNTVGLRVAETPEPDGVAPGSAEALDKTGTIVIEELDVTVMPRPVR